MDQFSRELLIARINSGLISIDRAREVYFQQPTSKDSYIVLDYCQSLYSEALSLNLHSEMEHFSFMEKNGLWLPEEETQYKNLLIDLDNWKVNLYESYFREKDKTFLKNKLKEVKKQINELHFKKHKLDHLSVNYYVQIQKNKLLLGFGLVKRDKKIYSSIQKIENSLRIDSYFDSFIQSRIDEHSLRELARKEPWKSYWNCGEYSTSLFGTPAIFMTDEQKQLILCSLMYENIFKHPDCPDDDIFEDDDCLDGWMILQKRKSNQEKKRSMSDSIIKNEKIKNSDEIMIVSDGSKMSIDRINSLNDGTALRTKKERFNYLNKQGIVLEQHMPDSQRKIRELAFSQGKGQK